MSLSDPSSILKIEKAVTSGTALVLYNIDGDVDSLFMSLIYHVTTSISEDIEQGVTQSLVWKMHKISHSFLNDFSVCFCSPDLVLSMYWIFL